MESYKNKINKLTNEDSLEYVSGGSNKLTVGAVIAGGATGAVALATGLTAAIYFLKSMHGYDKAKGNNEPEGNDAINNQNHPNGIDKSNTNEAILNNAFSDFNTSTKFGKVAAVSAVLSLLSFSVAALSDAR